MPVAPGEIHLYAEHCKYENDHEQPETGCAHKSGDGAVGGIFREYMVIEIAPRACVSTPPSSAFYCESYRGYHADERQKSYYRIKISYYKISCQYPV